MLNDEYDEVEGFEVGVVDYIMKLILLFVVKVCVKIYLLLV